MKSFWLAFSFLLATMFIAPACAADGVFPYHFQKETLPNGLTVYMIPMPSPGLVSYFTVVRTGSRDEVEPGKSGYAHFFEHMMFRGTKKHPGGEYDAIVAGLGAQANAFTSDDMTAFHLTFAKEDLERVIDIESDRFQNLDYAKPAFQTEAGAVYGEYRIASTQPGFWLEEKMQDLAFDVHTYKHTTMGFEADIKAMPEAFDYSRSFHHRFYRPENVVVLAVGDIDPPATLALIEKYYGEWKPGYQPPKIKPEPPQTAPRSAEIHFPGRTLPILAIGYKGDAFDPANRDYVAARLLVELAFGPQSELYKRLVLREQRVEMLDGDVPINRDSPLFSITAVVKRAEDIDAVRREIERTLDQFKTTPVDRQKLDDLKRRERYAFAMNLDTSEKTAAVLVRYVAVTGGIEAIDRLFAASDKITPEDIQRAAAKYFVPERRTTVVLKGTEEKPLAALQGDKPSATSHDNPSSQESPRIANRKKAAKRVERAIPESPVLLPVADDPTISFRLWFETGSQDDPPGKEGLATVTAALISDGATKQNSFEQILDKLFPLAAGYSASASEEMTLISGRVHKDNLDRFYPLLVEAVCQPAFNQEDLNRIKSQMLNHLENSLRYSNDEELGRAMLYYDDDPRYGVPFGTVASLKSISLDDVKEFYRKHYTRANLVIGLGGGYDASLLEKLRKDLATLPSGSSSDAAASLSSSAEYAPKPARRVTIVEKDCHATAVSIGFPLDVLRGEKDWYALALASSWLGQHRNQNGRLYQAIREARGLNYGDYTYLEHFFGLAHWDVPPTNVGRHHQLFEIWIRPVPNAARHFALRAALREFQHLVDHGMTREQFDETRQFLRKFTLHLAPTTMDRLGYALDDRFYGIDGSHLEKFRRAIDGLTLAEVNAAIKKHLQYKDLDIVIMTKDAEALKDALVRETPSPIHYTMPKPESVLGEDREISVFPLNIKSENVQIVPAAEVFEN